MSEDENVRISETPEDQNDVEAHKHRANVNEDGTESEESEDFEAHRAMRNKQRSV
jgi:hypothetical protein